MAQQGGQAGPISPERDVIHESDMHGIVALLQLSAGKGERERESRKRRDSIGSPTQLCSPGKRGRGYSPGGASLSPPSRMMHMPATHHMPCMSPPQVGLQSIQGLQVPGVASISSMVRVHELSEWARQEKSRVDRATAPLPDGVASIAFADRGGAQSLQSRVVSKRALQREARREARRNEIKQEESRGGLQSGAAAQGVELERPAVAASEIGSLHVDEGRDKGGTGTGRNTREVLDQTAPIELMKPMEPMEPTRKDDKHGSLLAFIGREFFYSDIDESWYGEGRTQIDRVLWDMGFDTEAVDVMLTKPEWAALVSSVQGSRGPRRLSSKFMNDSRAELRRNRERGEDRDLYPVGQAVTAMHPETLEIRDGTVLSFANNGRYQVQFDPADLGVHTIPASGLRKTSQTSPFGQLHSTGQHGPGVQQSPHVHPPEMQSMHVQSVPMTQQQSMAGVPLSHMLAAFIQHTRTPETSPEKVPIYALPSHQNEMPGKSPSQLLEDVYQSKLEEEAKAALESIFDRGAVEGMEAAQKRSFVLSELNKALRSACSQENRDIIDRNVSHMYADCVDEIDSIKDGQGMLGGAIQPLLDFGLAIEFETGCRGHERMRHELGGHIKELMAMLMMLERMPGMFDVFLRGLDLLS